MASNASFDGAKNFTISGGNFGTVEGNINTVYVKDSGQIPPELLGHSTTPPNRKGRRPEREGRGGCRAGSSHHPPSTTAESTRPLDPQPPSSLSSGIPSVTDHDEFWGYGSGDHSQELTPPSSVGNDGYSTASDIPPPPPPPTLASPTTPTTPSKALGLYNLPTAQLSQVPNSHQGHSGFEAGQRAESYPTYHSNVAPRTRQTRPGQPIGPRRPREQSSLSMPPRNICQGYREPPPTRLHTPYPAPTSSPPISYASHATTVAHDFTRAEPWQVNSFATPPPGTPHVMTPPYRRNRPLSPGPGTRYPVHYNHGTPYIPHTDYINGATVTPSAQGLSFPGMMQQQLYARASPSSGSAGGVINTGVNPIYDNMAMQGSVVPSFGRHQYQSPDPRMTSARGMSIASHISMPMNAHEQLHWPEYSYASPVYPQSNHEDYHRSEPPYMFPTPYRH